MSARTYGSKSYSPEVPAQRATAGHFSAKPSARTIKRGGAGVKHNRLPLKTAQAATRTAKRSEQAAQAAKRLAQRSARPKGVLKASARLSKLVIRVAASAAKALVGMAVGGAGLMVPVILVFAIVAAIVASPFGIFFSGGDSGPGVKPLSQIVSETNAELLERITVIQSDYDVYDSVSVVYEGSEGNMPVNNWCDVIAVFAVKTALADSENAAEVVTLDEANEARIKAVFRDMTRIESGLVTATIAGDDGEDIESFILQIVVDCLTAEDGASLYRFTDDQKAILNELMSPENTLLLLELAGHTASSGLSPSELAGLRAALAGLTPDREDFVSAALTLEGRVSYFWGGKSAASGWDERWGSPTEVTAAGSKTTGTTRPFGLDCSGFVAWCYAQIGISPDLVGWGSERQWHTSGAISWDNARPGDLVFYCVPGAGAQHVGIVAGFDSDGNPLIVHCNSSANTVTVSGVKGFKYIRRPVVFA